ncbi:MAG: preprotein translocase subunit SecA, partial [Flavitalea sp.]
MLGFISKIFGGSKSEKDIRILEPIVGEINRHFASYQSLSNDQLRGKTVEFRARITEHLKETDEEISSLTKKAEELPFEEIADKDTIFQKVDELKKDRDKKIEEILKEIHPEAFAVVKETARRFKENPEMIATATELDRELASKKEHVRIEGENSIFKNSWNAGGNL